MKKVKTVFDYTCLSLSVLIILRGLGSLGKDLEDWRQSRKLQK